MIDIEKLSVSTKFKLNVKDLIQIETYHARQLI